MFDHKCVWSALYPISNHSHIRQLQFATHAFSQQVLQQAVQISICQCKEPPQREPGEKERKKERKKKKRTETAGVKTPTKIFTAELIKFAEVMENSQRTHITKPCSFRL